MYISSLKCGQESNCTDMLSEKQEENTKFKPSEVSSAAASFTG